MTDVCVHDDHTAVPALRLCDVDDCEKPSWHRGWCTTHYFRWRRTGTTDPSKFCRGEPEEYFWRYVDKGADCWLWTGVHNNHGYGVFKRRNRSGEYAHRFSYELHKGPIPDGLHVMHSCDVPACVNPDHLSVGTRLDNLGDAAAKGRTAHGERNAHAKVTAEQVREIRKLAASGMSQSQIAARYDITGSQVGRIVRREAWVRVV